MQHSPLSARPAATSSPGTPVEVAPGILLLRLSLPTRLNHVNVYIFEDDNGWTVLDTGMSDPACRAEWEIALAGVLSGRPITRLIASHFHIDHVGLAGWLHERFSPSFFMSQTEYLLARVFQTDGSRQTLDSQAAFFRQRGLDAATAQTIATDRQGMRRLQTALPVSFERLRADDVLRIGGRNWRVLTGAGHAVEQVMLHAAADNLFISADQVLPEISPNISVGPMLPDADPLGDFLQSLRQIKAEVSDDALVFPGHRTPFVGLHDRIAALETHHKGRCAAILRACQDASLTGAELVPVVFGRSFGIDVIGSAVGEAVAHANYLQSQGMLREEIGPNGVVAYRAS